MNNKEKINGPSRLELAAMLYPSMWAEAGRHDWENDTEKYQAVADWTWIALDHLINSQETPESPQPAERREFTGQQVRNYGLFRSVYLSKITGNYSPAEMDVFAAWLKNPYEAEPPQQPVETPAAAPGAPVIELGSIRAFMGGWAYKFYQAGQPIELTEQQRQAVETAINAPQPPQHTQAVDREVAEVIKNTLNILDADITILPESKVHLEIRRIHRLLKSL